MRVTLPDTAPARAAARAVQRLRGAGHRALLVGGCVRSLLLREEPKDYDVATDARPDEVQALFDRVIPIGIAFGVVIVAEEEIETEVATFRSDGRYIDHRHPETVTFSDERADAQRRDFTVNALFLDPDSGEIIDHVGGLNDLSARLIRAVGDARSRFGEDALRLLRAIRFAARCAFEIEPETWESLRACRETIRSVSAERVSQEIVGMLVGPRAGDALRLLDRSGLLGLVLREVADMRGVEQPAKFHPEGDVFEHTCLCLDQLPPDPSPTLALGLLLHDVGKPATFERAPDRIRFSGHDKVGAEIARQICRRLRLSNETTDRVCELVRAHMGFINIPHMRPATLKRFLLRDDFDELAELHRCDAIGSGGTGEATEWCLAKREELRRQGETRLPPPLITGDDLIGMGFEPGPLFRRILEDVQTEQLEGQILTTEAARAHVARTWSKRSELDKSP